MNIESYKMLPMNEYVDLVNRCERLDKENQLLNEELCTLKNDIIQLYHTMMGLESITKHELEDIEEI